MRKMRRFTAHWQNILGLVIVCVYIAIAIAAPVLAPLEETSIMGIYFKQVIERRQDRGTPLPPSREAPLGTLPGGWDVLYSLVWGTRSAIRLGLIVALGSAVIGITIGAVSGYLGGRLNIFALWITDVFIAFPPIAGVVLFRVVFEKIIQKIVQGPEAATSQSSAILTSLIITVLDPVTITLILFLWSRHARLINVNVARIKESQYIQASKALGASSGRILRWHLIPNAISPAIVLIATDIGSAVILSASFTFVGLGSSSLWGGILVMSRDWIIGPGGSPFVFWWTFVPTSLALILFGIGWNLLGDGLNAMLEPRKT
jgi:peptide/nickel transport system permease protein